MLGIIVVIVVTVVYVFRIGDMLVCLICHTWGNLKVFPAPFLKLRWFVIFSATRYIPFDSSVHCGRYVFVMFPTGFLRAIFFPLLDSDSVHIVTYFLVDTRFVYAFACIWLHVEVIADGVNALYPGLFDFTYFFAVCISPEYAGHSLPDIAHVLCGIHVDEGKTPVDTCHWVHRHLEEVLSTQDHVFLLYLNFVNDVQYFLLYLLERYVFDDQSGEGKIHIEHPEVVGVGELIFLELGEVRILGVCVWLSALL